MSTKRPQPEDDSQRKRNKQDDASEDVATAPLTCYLDTVVPTTLQSIGRFARAAGFMTMLQALSEPTARAVLTSLSPSKRYALLHYATTEPNVLWHCVQLIVESGVLAYSKSRGGEEAEMLLETIADYCFDRDDFQIVIAMARVSLSAERRHPLHYLSFNSTALAHCLLINAHHAESGRAALREVIAAVPQLKSAVRTYEEELSPAFSLTGRALLELHDTRLFSMLVLTCGIASNALAYWPREGAVDALTNIEIMIDAWYREDDCDESVEMAECFLGCVTKMPKLLEMRVQKGALSGYVEFEEAWIDRIEVGDILVEIYHWLKRARPEDPNAAKLLPYYTRIAKAWKRARRFEREYDAAA
jgi:hypothetical protein